MIPNQLWELTVKSWNASLAERIKTGEGGKGGCVRSASTARSKRPIDSIVEAKQIIGCILLCSLTEKSNFNEA